MSREFFVIFQSGGGLTAECKASEDVSLDEAIKETVARIPSHHNWYSVGKSVCDAIRGDTMDVSVKLRDIKEKYLYLYLSTRSR